MPRRRPAPHGPDSGAQRRCPDRLGQSGKQCWRGPVARNRPLRSRCHSVASIPAPESAPQAPAPARPAPDTATLRPARWTAARPAPRRTTGRADPSLPPGAAVRGPLAASLHPRASAWHCAAPGRTVPRPGPLPAARPTY
ncbi:hypothetical protein G6F22_020448 [Rhizopus arrhizus]|nr:hypothetical protein G6F22_020448 [Rhizopus arrhizus]